MRVKKYHAYKIGDMAPESGIYECVICGNSKQKIFLKEGEQFPRCLSCCNIHIWKRSKITFPSFIWPHLFHKN